MRIHILVAALAAASLAGQAAAQVAAPLQASYPTDATLTCEQIAGEVARMDALMVAAAQAQSNAAGQGRAAEAGASVAITGALHAGLLGRVPFAGQAVNAAAGMAKQKAAQAQAVAAEQAQTATVRKTIMLGLFQGKACGAPQAPAVTPVSATTATPGV